jgi:hypothetical protein
VKRPREVRLIVEAAFHGNVRQRQLAGLHETDGSVKTQPRHELVRGHTNGGAEETRKMERADASPLCQGHQRHIVLEL